MLQRVQTESGVVFYRSPLLHSIGIPHAFSTRVGGISPAPFDSLNLGNPNGCDIQDDYARIWDNYRLLQRAAGCDEDKPCRVHQVHGPVVVRVRRGEAFDTAVKADALVSDDPSRVMSVRVADCVPVLIASSAGDRVAAIHAGWRGVIAGAAVAALRELAGDAAETDFVAAVGPCIGYDAFQVGQDVLQEFARVFGPDAPCRPAGAGKGYVDLRQAVRRQLIDAGIPGQQIDMTDRCTYRDRDEFYSHRRDNGVTGRMAAVIQCK
jgi:hypothetical protein